MKSSIRPLLQVALPLAVVAVGVAGNVALSSLKEDPVVTPPETIQPLVSTVRAAPASIELVVHAQGVVRPRTETTLVSEVDARVVELSPRFREGGFFEAGELLVRLDDTDLRLTLEDANSRVAEAELVLAQEEADAEISLRDWRSVHGEDPPPPLVARVPQLTRARAAVAAAEAVLSKAERDVDRSVIRAPYPGRVRDRMVDVGTYVTRGRDLGRVYAVDVAEIRLPVPDEDLAVLDLPLGGEVLDDPLPVRFESDFAGATHAWDGHVVRTTGTIDPLSRMVVLVAEVEDPYGLAREGDRPPLYPGLFVDAWIAGRTLDGAIALPREALQVDGSVYLLGDEDRLVIRPVDVVHREPERVVVRSGVEAGERVIFTPLETPVEGMRLREAETSRPSDDETDARPDGTTVATQGGQR